MSQRSRVLGVALALLLLGVVLSGCGAAPVAENWPGLTLDGDTIYVISGLPQQVFLLDAETGAQKVAFTPQGERRGVTYWSPVTPAGELAFAGFGEPQSKTYGLYAFDPATGQEQWHVSVEDLILAAPAYAGGVVYFGTSDGRVYAVDVETRGVKPGWPFEAGQAIWAAPLVAEGRVYVSSMDHHLYCLDADTGQQVWAFEAGGAMAARPSMDASGAILYVGAFDGRVYAVQAGSGQAVEGFEFQAENWIWSEVLVAGDQLYVSALDGKLYALDPASGAVNAPYPYDSQEVSGESDVIRAAPVQAGEWILVATESGRVIALKNGLRQWTWPSGVPQSGVLTTPVVSGAAVYVALTNGQVQTLQLENGVPGWSFSPPEGE